MNKKMLLYIFPIFICLAVLLSYRWMVDLSIDSTPPVITASEELVLSILDGQDSLMQGITATDDRDGDVTGTMVIQSIQLLNDEGLVQVTYAAFDKSGNVAKLQRQVQYTDYEGPRFALSAPLVFQERSNIQILDLISANDSLDGDISKWIRANALDGSSITTVGEHSVQFQVTNSLGDTATLVLPVEVYSAGTYAAQLELTDYLIYLPTGRRFYADRYLSSFTLNGNQTSLKYGLPEGFSLSITGEVDTSVPGIYVLSYVVSHVQRNETVPEYSQTYTGYSRLVVVVED